MKRTVVLAIVPGLVSCLWRFMRPGPGVEAVTELAAPVQQAPQALKMANELEEVELESKKGAMTTVQPHKMLDGISLRNSPATKERYENTVRKFLATLGPGGQATADHGHAAAC
jgi:hypothetical protein